LASPKSITFAWPVRVSMMFPGLMSRWTIPLLCAVSSASATSMAIGSASPGDSAPCSSRSFSDWPSTYSMTMTSRPPASATSLMWQMNG
jgi:hypothetical protein